MLYLEDYVELIEHLPSDLCDRFTEMREMDLQVQNTMDSLDDKVKQLFQKCMIKKGKISDADEVYRDIRKEYYKALEDADEKVQLANQIYDLVDRHLRKLDQELSKFKMELEADNAGITEILEQRSLDLDNPASQQRSSGHASRERRKHSLHPSSSSSSLVSLATNNGEAPPPEKVLKTEHLESELSTHLQTTSDNATLSSYSDNSVQSWMADSDVTAVRATHSSQLDFTEADTGTEVKLKTSVITEEQRMLPIGSITQNVRRSSSNKSNYDLIRNTDVASRFAEFDGISVDSLDTSGEHISDSSLSSLPSAPLHRSSRPKKQTSKAAAWVQARMQAEARHEQRKKEHLPSTGIGGDSVEESTSAEANSGSATVEWNYDPNEPRYCICNQVSYGAMVGCDNSKCPLEWFHYGCVELTEAPKGKWYCPQCTQTMKRRKQR